MARPTDYTSESKLVDIKDLVPYARNARTHSEQQVSQIAASIKEFGFLNPIIIDGDNGIIAGHGRLLAAQKLGLQSVPVVEAKHLTDAQKKAYIIADNRLALNAGWDTDLLKIEFEELNALDFDLSLTGFEDGEIAELFVDIDALGEFPELNNGERNPIQQMTFTLHDDQAEVLKEAISVSKSMGPFIDTNNENSNGNAIARIAEIFINWCHKNGES